MKECQLWTCREVTKYVESGDDIDDDNNGDNNDVELVDFPGNLSQDSATDSSPLSESQLQKYAFEVLRKLDEDSSVTVAALGDSDCCGLILLLESLKWLLLVLLSVSI